WSGHKAGWWRRAVVGWHGKRSFQYLDFKSSRDKHEHGGVGERGSNKTAELDEAAATADTTRRTGEGLTTECHLSVAAAQTTHEREREGERRERRRETGERERRECAQ